MIAKDLPAVQELFKIRTGEIQPASLHVCLFIIIDASWADEEARKVYKRQWRVRAALPLPRCHAATAFALLSTMSSYAMSIQPARELFTLNVIQEIFRDGLPNIGSLVKVNFE